MIQKTYQHIAAAALLLLLFVGSVQAQQAQTVSAPRMLSYQGVLSSTGTAGNDTAGNRLLKVTLYGDANGTTKLWQSTMNTPVDANGVFNCMLGSVDNPLPPPTVMDRAIWLGVSIDNAPELRPLSEVSASAYAINVADSSITTAKIAEGAVTWDKMGTEYLPYIRVNGTKVTTGHNSINFTGSEGLVVDWDSLSMSVIVHPDSSSTATNKGGGMKPMYVATNPCGGNSDGTNSGNTVSGGCQNVIIGTSAHHPIDESTISGGQNDIITNLQATGPTNDPDEGTNWHFIGGGENNQINIDVRGGTGPEQSWMGASSIVGGDSNLLASPYGFIGGGLQNAIASSIPTFGEEDLADSMQWDVIVGGLQNTITKYAKGSIIGGGRSNTINGGRGSHADYSIIGGGNGNIIYGEFDVIAGGYDNKAVGDLASVLGGSSNWVYGQYSAIASGFSNQTNNYATFVGAGDHNNASGSEAAIVAGTGHTASGANSFIGGGNTNTASNSSTVVAGGFLNTASGNVSAIGGGSGNTAAGEGSVIAGGGGNTVDKIHTTGQYSVIAGGDGNQAGRMTFVGGGYLNDATGATIGPNIDCSATVGGSNLITSGQNQTVIGCSNLPSGHDHFTISPGMPNDDRIFEIGSPYDNGITWMQNNAFEVSYNGHSIVTQTLGQSLLGTPVLQGATYVESPVYAWGEVDGSSGNVVGTSSFGITQSLRLDPVFTSTPGTYMVTLVPADPHGDPLPDLSQCSITITIDNDYTADITTLPPPPPQVPAMRPDVRQAVPDSVILALHGTLSNPDTSGNTGPNSPQSPPPPQAPPTFTCGYATASVIGVLGSSYPYSFIVRTYSGGGESCNDKPLTFFFKVCHR